jgi:hypothetical protein
MSGRKRFRPLDSDEAQDFEIAAKEHDDFLTTLTARALFYLGLRPSEFIHTVGEWIVRRGTSGQFLYDIRPYKNIESRPDQCTRAVGKGGQRNSEGVDLYERGNACQTCRKSGDTDGFTGKTGNAARAYPLDKSPELKQLGEDFLWFFEQNDFIPFGNAGVNARIRDVAQKAGIGESRGYKSLSSGDVIDITAYDLRHTYGTRLAQMDFRAVEIKSMMGHGSTKMPEKYISFSGKRKGDMVEKKWDPDVY